MKNRRIIQRTVVLLLALLLLGLATAPARALPDKDEDFAITWSAVASGGAKMSGGGYYILGGTIGQAAAGPTAGSQFSVVAGFWSDFATQSYLWVSKYFPILRR